MNRDSECAADQFTQVKEVVKQIGTRSERVLSEMRNVVNSFEHLFQINNNLSEENEQLKSKLANFVSVPLKYIEWSSKTEEENVELKRILSTQICDNRAPELCSFQATLSAKHQGIDGVNGNLQNVKKALFRSVSQGLSTSNQIMSSRFTQSSYGMGSMLEASTPILAEAMSHLQSKHDLDLNLNMENEIVNQESDNLSRRSVAKEQQIIEPAQHSQQTMQKTPSSSQDNIMGRTMPKKIATIGFEQATEEMQIDEFQKKLISSTCGIETNVASRSMNKDDANEFARRLEESAAELIVKNKQTNDLNQLQNIAPNSSPQLLRSNTLDRTIPTAKKDPNAYRIKRIDSDESNITDVEILDGAKIRMLQKGASTMASLIREKYAQLRNQRDEIESLRLRWDCSYKSCGNNESRVLRTENLNCNGCEKLKERLLLISKDNKLQVEIYSRMLYLQEGHITTLLAESQQLIHKHTNLMKCITLCHQELSKYIPAN